MLRKGGRLVWFGVTATARHGTKVIPLSLLMRFIVSLIPDGRKAPMPPDGSKPIEWYRDAMTTLFDHLATGKLSPVIADRIPLNEAARAHEFLERGTYAGKVVLVADAPST